MKTAVVSFALAATFALTAAAEKPPFDLTKKPKDEAERQARKEYFTAKRLKFTGGELLRPGTQQGKVVYVNCQSRAARAWIDESVDYFKTQSKFNIDVVDGRTFDLKNPKIEGNASLFIIDDPSLPPLLIAPENRWTAVNVANLGKDGKPAYFQARVKKELSRGFAALCGAMNSSYPNALTGSILKPEDLDTHPDLRLPVDVLSRFQTYMAPFGVTPAVIATYRTACKEGWAPAPTNDAQKAIVEQVKASKEETLKGPSNPRKIKYDAKKGE